MARADASSGSRRLRITGLDKSFGEQEVLRDVSLEVAPGTILALLGPSGSGKTTLLRAIAGLETPEAGTVELGDQMLFGRRVSVPAEKRRIGMVFQDWALFPHLNVADNVGFGLGRRPDAARVAEVLDMVGLGSQATRMPGTLSGGQQQRVALARAMAPRPEVLLLDEPFSNLDVTLRSRLRREVHGLLRAAAVTSVFVTHDQDEAFVLGDRVAVMNDGCIEQVAAPSELYVHPTNRWVAGFVGDANLLRGDAHGDRAATACGEVGLARPADGAVDVLVRPEHLSVTHSDEPSAAEVTFVEYYGHDAMITLAHPEVGELRVRALASDVAPGDRVSVHFVGGPTIAFPALPAPSR